MLKAKITDKCLSEMRYRKIGYLHEAYWIVTWVTHYNHGVRMHNEKEFNTEVDAKKFYENL